MSDEASKRASEQASQSGKPSPARAPVRTYRDLIVWQRSMELAEETFHATRSFPDDERWVLVTQMRRAANSVPSNIADGHARQSRKDYLRFLRTARGSLVELETEIELARRFGYLPDPARLFGLARECALMLQAMIRKLQAKGGGAA